MKLALAVQDGGAKYLAIADAIAEAIRKAELRTGMRLPTQRDLARELGVSPHTVTAAYAEVQRRGLISGEVGRGTFVRMGAKEASNYFLERRTPEFVDMTMNRPTMSPRHVERARAVLSELSERDELPEMLGCRPTAGLDHHRAAGERWLLQRGLEVPADQVIVCNGATHGIHVAISTLARPGDVILADALTDYGFISLSEMHYVKLQALESDGEGIVPDSFEAACRRSGARVLFVTPCLNNPTATTMGSERRRQLAAIAERWEVTVIENDVYGMLVPDAPPPLFTYLPHRTVYVTSLTKVLMSGLRTGYIAAPIHLIQRLVSRVRATSWMATPLVAEIAARWIADGTAATMLDWQRKELTARHKIARSLLSSYAFSGHPCGLHIWLELPEQWRSERFVREARVAGVAVMPPDPFVVGRANPPHCIRVSLGAPISTGVAKEGLTKLAATLDRMPELAALHELASPAERF